MEIHDGALHLASQIQHRSREMEEYPNVSTGLIHLRDLILRGGVAGLQKAKGCQAADPGERSRRQAAESMG
jgi:hypothetical protein